MTFAKPLVTIELDEYNKLKKDSITVPASESETADAFLDVLAWLATMNGKDASYLLDAYSKHKNSKYRVAVVDIKTADTAADFGKPNPKLIIEKK